MANFRNIGAARDNLERRVRSTFRSVSVDTENTAQELLAFGRKQLEGPKSSAAAMARAGHPYSALRRNEAYPLLPYHQWSGELAKSLRMFSRRTARGVRYYIWSTSRHAVALHVRRPGASIVERGFIAALHEEAERLLMEQSR